MELEDAKSSNKEGLASTSGSSNTNNNSSSEGSFSKGNQLGLCLLLILVGVIALLGLIIGALVMSELRSHHDFVSDGVDSGGREDGKPKPGTEPDTEEECKPRRTTATCQFNACENRYRTHDGTCNNQHNPLWGSTMTPFKRLLQPIYEDEVNAPVGWDNTIKYHGYPKPNARRVSQEIMRTKSVTRSAEVTDFAALWGVYNAIDIGNTLKTDSLCTETCTQKAPYCFPIMAPENDHRLAKDGCVPLTRSWRVCDLKPRQQMNGVTSYQDAGARYGNSRERANALRDLSNDLGHMKEGPTININGKQSKRLLPYDIEDDDFPTMCSRPRTDDSGIPCFFSGDTRVNYIMGFTALHTLWNREHNRIADELKSVNPGWNGETLYQEARKIVGALQQKITFEDWLPKTVGSKGMDLLGDYTGYSDDVDASAVISFQTATMRHGHAQTWPNVTRLGVDFQEISFGSPRVHETSFCPAKLVNEGGIDPILRGRFHTPIKTINSRHIVTEELTEKLNALSRDISRDLASLNIQRGREHGLPGYNEWRKFCQLSVAESFDELSDDISDATVRQKLEDLYGHPGNMDLWVAGLVEDPWFDSLMGPTFTCLLVEQFRRHRDGDRFWYENPGVFTPEQLVELKKHSLSRAICDSGDDIQEVQTNVFEKVAYPDGYKSCDDIMGMDISGAWEDTEGIGNVCGEQPEM